LVVDFPVQTAGINALSSFLAEDLSASLEARLPAGIMIPRSKLREFLISQDVSPLNLQSVSIAGGTLLKPTYWPNPPYSEEARKDKLQGSRTYDVFFDAQGNPLLIMPHRPLKPEFDDIAIETIKTRKAQPATMQGKPVAVCATIEMNWRLC
jgi:hypothetical protein